MENSHIVSVEKALHKSVNFNFFATGGLSDSNGMYAPSKKVFVASFFTQIDQNTQIKARFKNLPDLPEAVYYHQSAVVKDAKEDTHLVVFGGLSEFGNFEGQESRNQVISLNLQKEFYYQKNFEAFYDTKVKAKWKQKAAMNEKRAGFSSVVTKSQLLFVFGGHSQGKLAEAAVERFDINQNSWAVIPLQVEGQPLHSLIGSGMTTDIDSEKVFILGGSDGQLLQSEVLEVDTRKAKAKRLPAMLDPLANMHSSFLDGKLHAFAGLGSRGDSQVLDLGAPEWRDLERRFDNLTTSTDLDMHNNPGCFVELS